MHHVAAAGPSPFGADRAFKGARLAGNVGQAAPKDRRHTLVISTVLVGVLVAMIGTLAARIRETWLRLVCLFVTWP